MNDMYKYGNLCDKFNMDGDISIGTGTVRVHDLFNPLPAFMKEADVVFCDPPCSKANINSFYAKAELEERKDDYASFHDRFWQVIDEIAPKTVFIEVFKSNKQKFIEECAKRFANIEVHQSMYYNLPKNKCWIIQASNEPLQDLGIDDIDEEKVIETICRKVEYSCIADPCMGKGLVAFYSNKYGKRFVGTELSKYRLAVCLERVSTGQRGNIN